QAVVREPCDPVRPRVGRAPWRRCGRHLHDRDPTGTRSRLDRIHRRREARTRPRHRTCVEIRDHRPGHRPWPDADPDQQRRRQRADSSHQRGDGLPTTRPDDRAPSPARELTEPYGVTTLSELYKEWALTGMIANIGSRLIEVKAGHLVMEGNFSPDAHGFPTSRGTIVHGGAIATLADEALASVAFTLAAQGEATATADLKVDYLRPCQPGKLV